MSGDGWGETQAAYHGLEQGCIQEQSRKGAERRGAQKTGILGCTVEMLPKYDNVLRNKELHRFLRQINVQTSSFHCWKHKPMGNFGPSDRSQPSSKGSVSLLYSGVVFALPGFVGGCFFSLPSSPAKPHKGGSPGSPGREAAPTSDHVSHLGCSGQEPLGMLSCTANKDGNLFH